MKKEEFINQAEKILVGERENQYGTTYDTHKRIAEYWSTYLDKTITPDDVAMMMVLLKVARTQGGGVVVDNYVDTIGYAAIAGEIATTPPTPIFVGNRSLKFDTLKDAMEFLTFAQGRMLNHDMLTVGDIYDYYNINPESDDEFNSSHGWSKRFDKLYVSASPLGGFMVTLPEPEHWETVKKPDGSYIII